MPPLAEVAEHVAPGQPRQLPVADDDAAGDRAPALAVAARDDGRHVAGRALPRRVARAALERTPAEVGAAALAAAHEVDLLDLVLADVADRQVARAAVEGEAPGVAQAVAVDLPARAVATHERVVGGDAVRPPAGGGGVDAQDLAEQAAEVLGVAARAVLVAAAAAVAGADVEVLVGAEQQQPAVVVALVVGHPQHEPRRAGGGAGGGRAPVLDHALVARVVGEVDVEAPRARVVGREGQREQALLAARRHLAADVEERRGAQAPADQHAHAAGLLDDEQAPAVAGRGGHEHRRAEAADALETHTAALRLPGVRRGARGRCRGGGGRGGRRRRRGVAALAVARAAGGHERGRGKDDDSRAPQEGKDGRRRVRVSAASPRRPGPRTRGTRSAPCRSAARRRGARRCSAGCPRCP